MSDATSFLGPEGIRVSANDIELPHGFVRTVAVIGYPREVTPTWLEPLYSHPATMDVSIHLEPIPAVIAAERLQKQRARLESSRHIGANRGQLLDPALIAAADDAERLAHELARGTEKLFRVGLYVSVRAQTREELDIVANDINGLLASLLLRSVKTTFRALSGWITTSPFGLDQLLLRHSMDTSAVATTFPFAAADLSQQIGSFYGIATTTKCLVFWDRFSQSNYNAVVLARSGAGKSYFTKLEVLRGLYRGIDTAIIDPEGEYSQLCESVGGQVVALGAPGVSINPFDLDGAEEGLSNRALFIQTLCSLLLREEITAEMAAIIDNAVRNTYASVGISDAIATHKRTPPLFSDFVAMLDNSQEPVARTLVARLRPFVSGSYRRLFEQQSTLRRSSHLSVFSLRDLPNELRGLGVVLILDSLWRSLERKPITQQYSIVVDEAWLIMAEEAGAEFLFRLAKSARKRNCGIVVVSQDAADLLSSDVGTAVVTNSATHVLLRQAPQTLASMKSLFGLSDGEAQFLSSADVGEALLLGGDRHIAFRAVASPEEHQLITTDPNDLAQ
jgi:type IV secretory pathway VirB4 component